MLYRRDVEFARGHGTRVEWELAEGRSDHAVRIHTAAMPRAVVRTVEQCNVPGLITDMQELADAADTDARARSTHEVPVPRLSGCVDGARIRGAPFVTQ